MRLELFIAKRLIFGKQYKNNISAPIIKIAVIAIALSLVMMMIAIATGTGLQRKIREKVAAFNGHIQIFNYDNNTSEVSVNPISTQQDFYPNFTLTDGIDHIQAVALKGGIIRTETTFEGIIAKGVGKEYRWDYMEEYLTEGRLPEYGGERNEETLISAYLANRLGFTVGTEFYAFFLKDDESSVPSQVKFKVVGIYDSGFQEFDATYIFVDLRHIQRINRWNEDEVGSFELFVSDFSTLAQKGREIYTKTPATLDSQTIAGKYHYIFEWLSLFDFNIAIIIGIMILVGGINVITALLVLILERTRMIGILKALGSANWSIRKVFLYNAAYLILVGLFWGNLLGLGLLLLQRQFGFIKLDAATYYVTQAPVYLNPLHILALNAGTLVLCLVMLLVPSYIITKIAPVKAIKFE